MFYQLMIPAQFAAAFAAGEVTLMSTAAGATTTLMAGGQIVGVATLAEVGGAAAATGALGAGGAGAAGAVAAGSLLWPVVIGVAAAAAVGGLLWWIFSQRESEVVEADTAIIEFEATPSEAEGILARAQAIVDAEYSRAIEAPRVTLSSH